MSDLKNYFMQPRSMKCGLNVYPIKIIEYEKFKKLAAKYIILFPLDIILVLIIIKRKQILYVVVF